MNASDAHVHQNFHYILAAALCTLGLLYSCYGAIAYYYFGAGTPSNILYYFYNVDVFFEHGKYPVTIFLEIVYIINLYCAIPTSVFPVT